MSVDDVSAGMKESRARSPLRWAFAMTWGQRGVTTIVTFALAAIVGPRDFGVVAMAMIYVAFIQLFIEQGLSTALIQRPDLEPEDLDSAFWMTLIWCVVLAGLSIALAGWWAGVNDTPELREVIYALSLLLPIQGMTVVQQSLLQRDLHFKKLALRSNLAATLGGGCGLGLAFAGFGVWALVAQQLTTAAVSLLLLWTVSSWLPGRRVSLRHARRLLAFSGHVFVGNLGVWVNRRVDALLMGIFFGPVAVGLYRLADRLVETLVDLVTRPVSLFSLPHFSRLQKQPERLRESVRSCIRLTLLTTVPAMLALAATSDYVMDALGPQWAPAADAMKLLALVGIGKALVLFTGPLLYALARPQLRTVMVWSLAVTSTVTFLVVALLLEGKGTTDQVVGMAGSRALVFTLAYVPISLAIAARMSGLSLRSLLPSFPGPIAAGLAAVGVVALAGAAGLDRLPPLQALGLVAALTAGTVGAALFLVERQVRSEARTLLRSVRRVAGRTA